MLNDFANDVALNSYLNLSISATKLNTALDNLNTNTTDPNLVGCATGTARYAYRLGTMHNTERDKLIKVLNSL